MTVLYVFMALVSVIAIILAIKLNESIEKGVQLLLDKEQLKELIQDEQKRSRIIQTSCNDKINDLNDKLNKVTKLCDDYSEELMNKRKIVDSLNDKLKNNQINKEVRDNQINEQKKLIIELQEKILLLDPVKAEPVVDEPAPTVSVEQPATAQQPVRKPRRPRARARKQQS